MTHSSTEIELSCSRYFLTSPPEVIRLSVILLPICDIFKVVFVVVLISMRANYDYSVMSATLVLTPPRL